LVGGPLDEVEVEFVNQEAGLQNIENLTGDIIGGIFGDRTLGDLHSYLDVNYCINDNLGDAKNRPDLTSLAAFRPINEPASQ
jgi:hypothetical protein